MRIGYSEDEDYPGQFGLWQANCRRSLRGQQGQRELRQLRQALLDLPERRLIQWALVDEQGGVCAVGAYARHKGLDLRTFDPAQDTDEVGIQGGMPRLVAWRVVEMNDLQLGSYAAKPLTPEQRWQAMLAWVEGQLERTGE